MKNLPGTALSLAICLLAGCAAAPPEVQEPTTIQSLPAPQQADPLEAGFQNLADQIVAGLRNQQASQIAVVQFQNLDGSVSEFGGFIAEEMITRLYQTGNFRVVEREMLNKVMAEHELATSGLVDESTAKELGKLLGVDAIATGTITNLGAEVRVNSRLIATETGSVFSAAAATLPKDSRVENLMGKVLVRARSATETGSAETKVMDLGPGRSDGSQPNTGHRLSAVPGKPGLLADYYNLTVNSKDVPLSNPIFQRVDATINASWAGSPVPRINPDWFAVRWTGYINFESTGIYTLSFRHDDGLRVWIGNRKVYDHWIHTGGHWRSVDITFEETGWLPFRAELLEIAGGSYCDFRWALPGAADYEEVLAAQFRHDAP